MLLANIVVYDGFWYNINIENLSNVKCSKVKQSEVEWGEVKCSIGKGGTSLYGIGF